jgi:hypothetical protein
MGAKERQQIAEGIRELSKADAFEVYSGEVVEVNESAQTIDVKIEEGAVAHDVRLKMTVDDDKGFYVLPKKGSYVVIAQMDGGVDYCLVQASEIDKVLLKIGDTTLVIDKDKTVWNGGNNHGMLIRDKSVERWNKIEEDINSLKQSLNGVLQAVVNEPGNGAPGAFHAAMKAALLAWSNQQLQKTTGQDVENDKVKH